MYAIPSLKKLFFIELQVETAQGRGTDTLAHPHNSKQRCHNPWLCPAPRPTPRRFAAASRSYSLTCQQGIGFAVRLQPSADHCNRIIPSIPLATTHPHGITPRNTPGTFRRANEQVETPDVNRSCRPELA